MPLYLYVASSLGGGRDMIARMLKMLLKCDRGIPAGPHVKQTMNAKTLIFRDTRHQIRSLTRTSSAIHLSTYLTFQSSIINHP